MPYPCGPYWMESPKPNLNPPPSAPPEATSSKILEGLQTTQSRRKKFEPSLSVDLIAYDGVDGYLAACIPAESPEIAPCISHFGFVGRDIPTSTPQRHSTKGLLS